MLKICDYFTALYPGGSVGKNLPASADMDLIFGLGRSSGEGNGNPLQFSYLENPMDRGGWQATVHRVAESDTIEATACTHAHTYACMVG